jgi:predicted permease
MAQVFAIVFPIFGIVALGYLYARRHEPDMASANRLNLEIFTPALIFSVLSGEGFELARYAELAFAAILVVLGSGLLAWPFARLFGFHSKTFLPPMMFNNSGNMGLPLALFAFGEAALPAAMVLFLVENTLHFTVGNAMLTGHVNPLKLIRMPMLLATLAGLLVAILEIQVPGPVDEAIDLLGQVAIPLMLFALGVRMTAVDLSDWSSPSSTCPRCSWRSCSYSQHCRRRC